MKHGTNLLWQIILVLLVVLLALWCATEWTAWSLGWSPRLGEPLFVILDMPVYVPWAFFGWWYSFDAYAPEVFDRGGLIAGSGGVAAIVIAVTGSILRARWDKRVSTFGSARWAEGRDLRRSGLLKPAGVFLGQAQGSYLRHDGPDHVMAFAPTRSGKGVGLVVPTLLSWPHSVLVHDIKGENWQLTSGWRSEFSHCLRFDPTDVASAHFNPLREVRRGPCEVRDVQNIADILVDPQGKLGDLGHWVDKANSLLVGVILHVLYAEREKTLARVASFLANPDRTFRTTLAVMMRTNHLGTGEAPEVHPVVAETARELMNQSENELSGVLSTALRFLSLYRDPVIAEVTSRSDFRIEDLVSGDRPLSLYLVVPPSDLSRTKPLMRLLLNQVGRRLTEHLDVRPSVIARGKSLALNILGACGLLAPQVSSAEPKSRRRVLFMLDEFPALGRLDFFESVLAYMAGYGLKAFLIAQSLNQIEKAYGPSNAILDNCHVRVAFATNDERTAKRISDALGTKTEQRAMKNYAGHRLAPWLSHKMVSRQETARQLLTPGEVMQLPADEELVLVAGSPPVRALKLRYFEDRNFTERLKAAPGFAASVPGAREDDWGSEVRSIHEGLMQYAEFERDGDGPGPQKARDAAKDRAQAAAPGRTGRPEAKSRGRAQPSLFDALVQADSLEQATGIDLTGNGE
ncbi:IncP-type conjugal transfer protein TraG [uncultured Hyphomonas sp.]|uniref:IncP-type conjugal transfer protein TraG n=1 Tax=uncultured Hyphomonas sp. TaxID=225298 RepID=UPI002AAB4D2D|nr:IncP-type conjugal transfer protein TraG [uncultured Hyphomonas sp.]